MFILCTLLLNFVMAHVLEKKWRSKDVQLQENVDFSVMLLSERVLAGLTKAGYKKPSPIQLEAIPVGRVGKDLLVQAKSGTGKTLVFTIVALEQLKRKLYRPQVLILAPTREIATQICNVIQNVGSTFPKLKCCSFIGGLSFTDDKENALTCQIAVGTPGRVRQLIKSGYMPTNCIRLLVFDEADQLLQGTFKLEIDDIFNSLPKDKQVIATSATYPTKLRRVIFQYFREPHLAALNSRELALLGIVHYTKVVKSSLMPLLAYKFKLDVLHRILDTLKFSQSLVFCNGISRVEYLCQDVRKWGFSATYISSAKEQSDRLKAMDKLKTFKCKVFISSDVSSRGIDAENVDLVVNFDIPYSTETYLHRVGRAGRYGSIGVAITLLSDKEILSMAKIESQGAFKSYVLPEPLPSDLIQNPSLGEYSIPDSMCNELENEQTGNDDDEAKVNTSTNMPFDYNFIDFDMINNMGDKKANVSKTSNDLLDKNITNNDHSCKNGNSVNIEVAKCEIKMNCVNHAPMNDSEKDVEGIEKCTDRQSLFEKSLRANLNKSKLVDSAFQNSNISASTEHVNMNGNICNASALDLKQVDDVITKNDCSQSVNLNNQAVSDDSKDSSSINFEDQSVSDLKNSSVNLKGQAVNDDLKNSSSVNLENQAENNELKNSLSVNLENRAENNELKNSLSVNSENNELKNSLSVNLEDQEINNDLKNSSSVNLKNQAVSNDLKDHLQNIISKNQAVSDDSKDCSQNVNLDNQSVSGDLSMPNCCDLDSAVDKFIFNYEKNCISSDSIKKIDEMNDKFVSLDLVTPSMLEKLKCEKANYYYKVLKCYQEKKTKEKQVFEQCNDGVEISTNEKADELAHLNTNLTTLSKSPEVQSKKNSPKTSLTHQVINSTISMDNKNDTENVSCINKHKFNNTFKVNKFSAISSGTSESDSELSLDHIDSNLDSTHLSNKDRYDESSNSSESFNKGENDSESSCTSFSKSNRKCTSPEKSCHFPKTTEKYFGGCNSRPKKPVHKNKRSFHYAKQASQSECANACHCFNGNFQFGKSTCQIQDIRNSCVSQQTSYRNSCQNSCIASGVNCYMPSSHHCHLPYNCNCAYQTPVICQMWNDTFMHQWFEIQRSVNSSIYH